MLRLNNHIGLYVDVLCFYALYHTKVLDQMNEYAYYGLSKVHDNSVCLPMYLLQLLPYQNMPDRLIHPLSHSLFISI